MNWSSERFIKSYTRDTIGWLRLSFNAQAVLLMIQRKVDRSGRLQLGGFGLEAVPVLLGHVTESETILAAVNELLKARELVLEDDALLIPTFEEAQEATATPAARMRKMREKTRDVTRRDAALRAVTTRQDRQDKTDETRQNEEPSVPTAVASVSTGALAPVPGSLSPPGGGETPTPKAKKPRTPSRQEAFYAWAMAERAKVFPFEDPDAPFSSIADLNKRIGEVLNPAGETRARQSWLSFLSSAKSRELAPPAPIRFWVKAWSSFAPKTAHNANGAIPGASASRLVQPGEDLYADDIPVRSIQ